MYKQVVFVLFLFNGHIICSSYPATYWLGFTKSLRDFTKNCPTHLGMFDCLKQSSLRVFDEMITYDSIPLTSNIKLTRNYHEGRTKFESKRSDQHDVASMANVSWSDHILTNMLNLFRTHTLKIDFTQSAVSGRGPNRRRNQMLPMMILGVTALGVFTIPMGFQFLAVISGKALLLAKMALMFAIMNGAKRVAASGVHYGLYHADPHQHGYHYLDRGDTNRPRFYEV